MDALKLPTSVFVLILCLTGTSGLGAETYQTINFSVKASSTETAEEVGKAAENYRRQLAIFWLGKPLPNWSAPCKIVVKEGQIGAGGRTTFQFVRGEVLNWSMEVQGTRERILDSVLPHEINHTIFACHFRRPLPRWADEGAATLFEHRSEQIKQLGLLNQVIRTRTAMITLRELLSMKNYPDDYRRMLTLYAQGYALADFLVQQKGRHAYLKFISDGERIGWEEAIKTNFDHDGIESLEKNWKGWILAGMPKLTLPREQMLAATIKATNPDPTETAAQEFAVPPDSRLASRPRRSAVVRSQSPESRASGESELPPIPPISDEAMPGRFLEADQLHQSNAMGIRIEAPRPKRVPATTQGDQEPRVVDGAGDQASTGSEPEKTAGLPHTDGPRNGSPSAFRAVSSGEQSLVLAEDAPSHREAKPDRQPLKPTSHAEETDPEQQRDNGFSQSTRQSAEKATGSKPSWARFPGAG
ncbi:MAG: hypothetical protein ACK58L_15325 [Planctomycetota bacterium]